MHLRPDAGPLPAATAVTHAPHPAPAGLPAPSALLQALRLGTGGHHAAIEAAMPLDTPPAPARYAHMLTGLLLGLLPWTARMAQALAPTDRHWLASAPRVARLRDDLAALGHHPAPEDLPAWQAQAQAAARAAHALPLATPAAAVGALYVLEGSALGGRVIAERIRGDRAWADGHRRAQPALRAALGYFDLGLQAGPRWRQFCQRLAAPELQHGDATQHAVDAARATFALLTDSVAQACRAQAQPAAPSRP